MVDGPVGEVADVVAVDANPMATRQRVDELYGLTWSAVQSGKNMIRRTKRSAITFADTTDPSNTTMVELGTNIAAGIVVAAAIGAIGLPIGWAFLASAALVLLVAVISKKIFNAYRRSQAKKKVLATLQEIEDGAEDNAYEPDFDNADLAEAFLAVLVRDLKKLPKEIARAKKDLGPRENLNLRQSRFRMETKIRGAFRRKLTPAQAARHRYKRITGYLDWLGQYFDFMIESIEKPLLGLPREVDGTVADLVTDQVGAVDRHQRCSSGLCFGAAKNELRRRKLTDAEKAKLDLARLRTIGAAPTSPAQNPGIDIGGDDIESSNSFVDCAQDYVPDQLINASVGGIGAAVDSITTNASELAATALPSFYIGMLGGGTGAVLSAAVDRGIVAMRVNYPLQDRVGRIRGAMADPAKSVDEVFKKEAEKNDLAALNRCLNKVHNHYIKRIGQRAEKLRDYIAVINGRAPQQLQSCSEAVQLVRYYHKTYHYVEKAMIHSLIVAAAITILNDTLERIGSQN